MNYREFYNKYSGVVILMEKKMDFVEVYKSNKFGESFFPLVKGYKYKIFVTGFITLCTYITSMIIPLQIQQLIDSITGDASIYRYIFMLFVSIVVNFFLQYIKNYLLSITSVQFDRDVNTNIIDKLLKVPYIFYETRSNSEIFFTLENINSVKNVFLINILNAIFDFGAIFLIMIYLIKSNFTFFLIVIVVLIPNILLAIILQPIIMQDNKLMNKEKSSLSGYQIEIINSILGIKTSSNENKIFEQWKKKYNKFYCKSRSYKVKINAFKTILSIMVTLSPVIILVIAIIFAKNGIITIGRALALFSITEILFNSIFSILNTSLNFVDNFLCVERLEDIMQYHEKIDNVGKKINITGDIRFDEISFKYSSVSKEILKGISFSIKSNSKVAIVGESGSGKSTLLKVLSGLYELENGEIYFDGYGIKDIDSQYLNKQIGFVAQNTWLLNKSIYENITMGYENFSINEVQEACKIVNIHIEIMNMPMKYNTVISEMGKNLSGGQCQRIVMARMVLLKPKLLLLDEATSALDILNEKRILEYFYKLKCTIIMVTHRMELLKDLDCIIVMKNGKICGEGNYKKLFAENEEFKRLIF